MRFLTALLAFAACLSLSCVAEDGAAPADTVSAEPETEAPANPEAVEEEPEAKPVLPLALHCGQLIKVTPVADVEMVDLDKMLAEGKLEAKPDQLAETITKEPDSGNVFAVAEIRLKSGAKVGKTDFTLRYGSETAPCIAVAESVGGFDARRWSVDKGTARLLFEVPDFATTVALEYAIELRIKLPTYPEFPFGEQPEAAEPPATESPEPAPTATPAVAKEEASKPEPETKKPAKEKKPEPKKPEPKPEPKKEEPADAGIPLF